MPLPYIGGTHKSNFPYLKIMTKNKQANKFEPFYPSTPTRKSEVKNFNKRYDKGCFGIFITIPKKKKRKKKQEWVFH